MSFAPPARHAPPVRFAPPARHLLRAKDLADARYFSRQFRHAFGESPHAYLLTRRLERAATLLRSTDHSVAEICFSVGLQSVGSFTTSFTRTYGVSPTVYRARFPPAVHHAQIPACVWRVYGRPQHRTFREDSGPSDT
jgi:AraC-like DNA-binding protein